MTAEEAFKELIENREYILTLPIDERNKISAYASQWRSGTMKLKNIDSLLEKHGYIKTQEPIWEHKKINK